MRWSVFGRRLWLGWTLLTDGLLCLLLLAMIILACLQIILRTFFAGGILWADTLLRFLVLWSGMLGAVVATREGKHITIDVITYLAPETIRQWISLMLNIFSLAVAGFLTWASLIFVRNEALFGTGTLLNMPSWGWNMIFPAAFTLITFHFFVALVTDILALFGLRVTQATRKWIVPDGE